MRGGGGKSCKDISIPPESKTTGPLAHPAVLTLWLSTKRNAERVLYEYMKEG